MLALHFTTHTTPTSHPFAPSLPQPNLTPHGDPNRHSRADTHTSRPMFPARDRVPTARRDRLNTEVLQVEGGGTPMVRHARMLQSLPSDIDPGELDALAAAGVVPEQSWGMAGALVGPPPSRGRHRVSATVGGDLLVPARGSPSPSGVGRAVGGRSPGGGGGFGVVGAATSSPGGGGVTLPVLAGGDSASGPSVGVGGAADGADGGDGSGVGGSVSRASSGRSGALSPVEKKGVTFTGHEDSRVSSPVPGAHEEDRAPRGSPAVSEVGAAPVMGEADRFLEGVCGVCGVCVGCVCGVYVKGDVDGTCGVYVCVCVCVWVGGKGWGFGVQVRCSHIDPRLWTLVCTCVQSAGPELSMSLSGTLSRSGSRGDLVASPSMPGGAMSARRRMVIARGGLVWLEKVHVSR